MGLFYCKKQSFVLNMIRGFEDIDTENVQAVLQLNIPKYFAPSEEADFIDYLSKYSQNYYVVEVENTIVGAGGINYFEKESLAKISWDFVHPDTQGKDWGTKLVSYRIRKIKENPKIETVVVRTSQHAHKFYEKCGFQLLDIVKDYWAKDFDLYEMKMEL